MIAYFSSEGTVDDRFDRRQLLLHLGDILEAMNCVARLNRPEAPVVQLAEDEEALHGGEMFSH